MLAPTSKIGGLLLCFKRISLWFIQPFDKSSSFFLEQNLLKNLSIVKVETIPDCSEWAHIFIGIFTHQLFAKFLNNGKIFIQATMEIRLLKAIV
jgi:hypothetical protein